MSIDHVEMVQNGAVTYLRRGRRHRVPFQDDLELAQLLMTLRDEGLPFVQHSHGWEPGDVFAELRERGLVTGHYDSVSWAGPDQPIVRSNR